MLVILAIAALVILACVVLVSLGRGGELTEFPPDVPPLNLPEAGKLTAVDFMALRLPVNLVGYHTQSVDETLRRAANAISARDTRIAVLEQRVSELLSSRLHARQEVYAAPGAGPRTEHEPPAAAHTLPEAGDPLPGTAPHPTAATAAHDPAPWADPTDAAPADGASSPGAGPPDGSASPDEAAPQAEVTADGAPVGEASLAGEGSHDGDASAEAAPDEGAPQASADAGDAGSGGEESSRGDLSSGSDAAPDGDGLLEKEHEGDSPQEGEQAREAVRVPRGKDGDERS